jgi:hypothetical protein
MPPIKPMPPRDVIWELLSYDPQTGKFRWNERPMKYFEREQDHLTWNSKFAGAPALDSRRSGYRYGSIFGENYTAHRVAWFYVTGEEPDEIDHKDGNRANNRFTNLRAADRKLNSNNHKLQSNNKSGHVGVSWHAKSGKWCVKVRREYIGLFEKLEDAVAARKAAAVDFYPNHGRHGPISKETHHGISD